MSQINVYGAGGGGGGTLDALMGDTGKATPVAGIINVVGGGTLGAGSGTVFTGSGSTLTLSFNNINMPNTTSNAQKGVITFGGTGGSNRFFHNYGDSGDSNLFIGWQSGNFTLTLADSFANVGLGSQTLTAITTGSGNTAIGNASSGVLTTGNNNTACGANSLWNGSVPGETTGGQNCAFGAVAMAGITSGSYNIGIGYFAGSNYAGAESGNILLNSGGVVSESNILRIGNGTGSGNQELAKAFISGINGNTVSNTKMVTINSSTDQLGTATIPSGNISITGDSGGALTSNAFTFTGGSTGLTFAGSGTTETLGGTLAIANGGTDATSFSTSTGIVKYDGTRLVASTTALIDSSNRMTNSSQPAFIAYLDAPVTDVTGDGTNYTIIFNATLKDQNSNFNTGSGTFTAPVTGIYLLGFSFLVQGISALNTIGLVTIQTTADVYSNSIIDTNAANVADANGNWQASGMVVVPMSATDTAFVTLAVYNHTKTVGVYGASGQADAYSKFFGYLIC